jgi:hypothetical protein
LKDQRGHYYYPFPENKRVRMYVQQVGPEVCFRMWNADDPKMWEKHGWVPYGAVQEASGIFKRRDKFDPQRAYDLDLALTLLRESKLKGD